MQSTGATVSEAAVAVQDARVEIRQGTKADEAFLFATLLRNYKASQFARRISNTVYFALHHEVIERILARGGHFVVAHPPGDPGTIVGYLLYERLPEGSAIAGLVVPDTVMHFLYVKRAFRGFGVARALMESQRIDPEAIAFTHLTPDGEALWRKYPGAAYWPHIVA